MSKDQDADKIIDNHVLWSLGAGLMPVPLFDIAAVTAVQMDMLKQLADLYEADFSKSTGKTFVSALTGSTFARIGASVIKAVPGIGTVVGGLSMSVMSGASTYAVGQVAKAHFSSDGGLLGDIDLEWAKEAYKGAFEKGKDLVEDIEKAQGETRDPYATLEKLGELRDKGVVTEDEFAAKKKELLKRM